MCVCGCCVRTCPTCHGTGVVAARPWFWPTVPYYYVPPAPLVLPLPGFQMSGGARLDVAVALA